MKQSTPCACHYAVFLVGHLKLFYSGRFLIGDMALAKTLAEGFSSPCAPGGSSGLAWL